MNIKWIATAVLSLAFLLPALHAQAGVHKEWHSQRLAHHDQQANYHFERYTYHKAELNEESSWWHAKRAEHHWEEYEQHKEEVKEHAAELVEDAKREASED
jgi:hypothetical protein